MVDCQLAVNGWQYCSLQAIDYAYINIQHQLISNCDFVPVVYALRAQCWVEVARVSPFLSFVEGINPKI